MRITIPGKPIAKKRPRFARRGKFVTTYNDQQTEEGKALLSIREQINGAEPITAPVFLTMEFVFQRPKSHYGTGKNAATLKPSAPTHHITKPDLDNCEKFIMDVLNDELWHDDAQVVSHFGIKRYALPGESPHTNIDFEIFNDDMSGEFERAIHNMVMAGIL